MTVSSITILLYILALHTSMAAMELFGWLIFLLALIGVAQRKVKLRTTLEIPILTYAFLVVLNILLVKGNSPMLSRMGELSWIFIYWGLVKVLETVWSERFEKKMITAWITGLAAATGTGIYQFFAGYDFIRGTSDNLPRVGNYFRSTGFFSLCLTYAYSMGASGLSLFAPASKRRHGLGTLAILLGATCVFVSMTRGAWIAMAVTLSLLAIILIKQIRLRDALIGLAAVGIFSFFMMESSRITTLVNTGEDRAVSERVNLWKGYFQMFKENPIFGIGFDEGAGQLPVTYQKLGIDQTLVSHAHNDYLQALAETGIVGFLAFLFMFTFALFKTFQLRKDHPVWTLSLAAGQLFIYLGCLTQANFTDAEVNHMLIFNWALVSSLTLLKEKESQADNM